MEEGEGEQNQWHGDGIKSIGVRSATSHNFFSRKGNLMDLFARVSFSFDCFVQAWKPPTSGRHSFFPPVACDAPAV